MVLCHDNWVYWVTGLHAGKDRDDLPGRAAALSQHSPAHAVRAQAAQISFPGKPSARFSGCARDVAARVFPEILSCFRLCKYSAIFLVHINFWNFVQVECISVILHHFT